MISPTEKFKILMVTPELAPYAKVGGLGDMVSSLAKALDNLGHDVRVVLPLYGCVPFSTEWKVLEGPLYVHLGKVEFCKVWEGLYPGTQVKIYFLEYNKYFHRPEVYSGPWGGHMDNHERFTFLSRASLDLCYILNWIPDIIHCHDWTTGLVPVYLNTRERGQLLSKSASIMTVHNMQHQGIFGKDTIGFAGLPESTYRADCLEALGNVNMLKGGLFNATKITTVSPHYAQEIQTPSYGYGLEGLLQYRAADLIGILNGIDVQEWDPTTDPWIPKNFSAEDFLGKAVCKKALQEKLGLEVKADIPVFSAVARMYEQKGLDLLADILPGLMKTMRLQVVIVGLGDPSLQSWFQDLACRYPGRLGVYIGYDHKLVHLVEAGSDFFVMPSRFEPCGLTQLYAMAYGTLPIVRATGGLVDTVENYKEGSGQGTGFVFNEASGHALYYTMGWACSTYYDRPKELRALQVNAMKKDFSAEASAKKYVDVYRWAIEAKKKIRS